MRTLKNYKKKILVVLGGNSREREISIKTGKACIGAIKRLGYKVEVFDPKIKSFFDIKNCKADVIFNALHGEEGEDGYAQSFFEYSKMDVASFKFNVSGFSIITGLPFLIASDAISKWVLGGVAIIIPSISDERVMSCQLLVTS